MKITLAYGKNGLPVDVPDNATIITPKHIQGFGVDTKKKIQCSLRNPIKSEPLGNIVEKDDSVCIVISDYTRPTPNEMIVGCILEELNHVPDKNIVILNGTGSHRPNSRAELLEMLGKDILDRIRVVNHDAFDISTLSYIGRSPSSAPVYLDREYVESDFKIVTGFIEPHFMAGFSGGPKGIMPGIAGIETIQSFHSASLIGNPMSTWGLIDGNPIQAEATDIALMCKPDFMVNVTLNGEKEVTNVFSGDVIAAHRAGCSSVREHAMVLCDEAFDIVVTTNSGFPLDQNLYQSVKGMCAAQRIVRKGGHIICAAECSDGLPSHGNYARILQMADTMESLYDLICSPDFSVFDQWQVQKQAMVQLWANVHLYSLLTPADCAKAKINHINSIEGTIGHLIKNNNGRSRLAVMPLGPLTIPYL